MKETEYPSTFCVVEDRYHGVYSGSLYLAFAMDPLSLVELPIDSGDTECKRFWDNEDEEYPLDRYTIGKGSTSKAALEDLIRQLKEK